MDFILHLKNILYEYKIHHFNTKKNEQLNSTPIMRPIEIQLRTQRYNTMRIDTGMTIIIMLLNMYKVYCVNNPGHLVYLTQKS